MDHCLYYHGGLCLHPTIGMTSVLLNDCAKCAEYDQRKLEDLPTNTDATMTRGVRDKPCIYLGPKRRCCDALYICKQSPGANCILDGAPPDGVRVCSACEFKSID